MDILIGADPELFVKKNKSFLSAFGLVPGSKKEPHKVDKGAVQVDGMALEFNIEPAASKDEFIHNITSVMDELRKMVPNDFELAVFPTAKFSSATMKEQPAEALELGCDPDFSAYTRQHNPRPKAPSDFRSAGGHVHVGWTTDADVLDADHFNDCCRLAQQLDWYLGLPSLFLDNDKDRRKIYGKSGAFRPKVYGMEYRTLSNFWIKDTTLMGFVYDMTQKAFDDLVSNKLEASEKYGSAEYMIARNDLHSARSYLMDMKILGDYHDLVLKDFTEAEERRKELERKKYFESIAKTTAGTASEQSSAYHNYVFNLGLKKGDR